MNHFLLTAIAIFIQLSIFAQSLTGIEGPQLLDERDSIIYQTVQFGDDIWTQDNCKHYVVGSDCFDHDTLNCKKYGRLYTYEQSKTACPSGWHVPSAEEWGQLLDIAGGNNLAGGKLRIGGISNFNVKMTGIRRNLDFCEFKEQTGFWSSSLEKETNTFVVFMYRSKPKVKATFVKNSDYRLSVRCKKD